MRVWSKGLGNMTLRFDFNASQTNWEDDDLTITGWIRDPVVWNYRITFEDPDIIAFLKVVMSWHVLRFVLRSFWRKMFPFLYRGPKKRKIASVEKRDEDTLAKWNQNNES